MQLRSVKVKKKYKNYRNFKMMRDSSFTTTMKDWLFSKGVREPEERLVYTKIDTAKLFTGEDSTLMGTWLGHSSFVIEHDGLRILLDPVLSNNLSPVPWLYSVKRFQKECPIKTDNLPLVDIVIISHNHYDHLDKKTIKKIHHKVSRFVVPMGVDRYLKKWGVPEDKVSALDWSQSATIGEHTITALPAQHFSGRGMFSGNKTLWASFAVRGPHHSFYYSGDTGYHKEFRSIGERHGPFNLVILDSGQFGVHWPDVHMFPEEAVQAHQDLQGDLYIPAHWGSFNLSTHNWWDPIERAIAAAEEKNVKLAVPYPGETTMYGGELPTRKWWKANDSDTVTAADRNQVKGKAGGK